MVIFYKWKKYNEIQLTKNKMDLNIRKMTNHPPSPAAFYMKRTTHYIENLTPIFGKGEETQDTTFDIKFT